jgi:2-methylcitrate dehydratase
LDWSREDLEKITQTVVKRYNAEIHSQATIEGVLELKHIQHFIGSDIRSVNIETFDVAYNIIGGGEEGEKFTVRTKEDADHSLPYIVAVAILDDQVLPPQYLPERIQQRDVQSLLRKVKVRPLAEFSQRFPAEMPCRITITLNDGRVLTKEKRDYEGFRTRPMQWETAVNKFEQLTQPHLPTALQNRIEDAVQNLENFRITDLASLLERLKKQS